MQSSVSYQCWFSKIPQGGSFLPPSQDGLSRETEVGNGNSGLPARFSYWSGLWVPSAGAHKVWVILVGLVGVMLEPTAGCRAPGLRPPPLATSLFSPQVPADSPVNQNLCVLLSGADGTANLEVEVIWGSGWTYSETGSSNKYGIRSLWLFRGLLWKHFCRQFLTS